MEVKQKISCACSRQEQVQEKHRNEWGMGQGLLPLSTGLLLEVYLKSMFQSGSVVVFPMPEIILLSTIKQNS
jgi:hypothetical protein